MWLRLLPFALLPLLAGCVTSPRATRDVWTDPDMMSALVSKLPPGTTVDDAERVMTREGFHCTDTKNGTWGDRTGLNYLDCARTDGWGLLMTKTWMVGVVYADGKVTEVLVKSWLTGP